jgi:hypothetical protein
MDIVMDVLDCKTRRGSSTESIECGFFRQSAVLSKIINYQRTYQTMGRTYSSSHRPTGFEVRVDGTGDVSDSIRVLRNRSILRFWEI